MYLIAYDIVDNKKRRKAQTLVYSYAFGGQKSALECLISKKEAVEIAKKLSSILDLEKELIK